MIIKVHATKKAVYNNNQEPEYFTTDSWRYYDNAKEVQYSSGTMGDFMQGGIATSVIEEHFIDATPGDSITLISFVDGQDVPRHIYTNTETYLMTDAGKTIERIS